MIREQAIKYLESILLLAGQLKARIETTDPQFLREVHVVEQLAYIENEIDSLWYLVTGE